MLQHFAEDLTFILLKNKIIDIDDRDIYEYGFQIILSTLIITIALLILGTVLNKEDLTWAFIITFTVLRTYTGGYHAKTFSKCFFVSIGIFLCQVWVNYIVIDYYKLLVGVLNIIISLPIIWILAPVEHKNNLMSSSRKNRYKKIVRALTLIILISVALGFKTNLVHKDVVFMVTLTVLSTAILVIYPILKGGDKYD